MKEEDLKNMSTKELCELLQEVYKSKEAHIIAFIKSCCKLNTSKEAVDVILSNIKPEDYSYFRNCYIKLKQKELDGVC